MSAPDSTLHLAIHVFNLGIVSLLTTEAIAWLEKRRVRNGDVCALLTGLKLLDNKKLAKDAVK